MKNFLPDPVYLVMTGFLCNNNCLECSVKPKGLSNKPRNTEEILADIEQGKKLNFKTIEFTGGEPTLRPDLPTLISKAKNVGYKEIALGTNCRTLSNLEYLKSLKKCGVNRITTTLYGHDAKNHDMVTRVPGSFDQTVKGIKNSLNLGITTSVNTVVFDQTVKNIVKIGNFISSIGVVCWTLLDLIPDGYAYDKYDSLSNDPDKLKKIFNKLDSVISKFYSVNIMDFPFCLFPSKLLSRSNCNFINAKRRTEIITQVGYKPKRFIEKNDVYFDVHKMRSKKCRGCAYYNDCGGVWIPYLYLYSDSFIKPFLTKINKGK